VYGYTYDFHYMEIPDTKVDCPVLGDSDVNECKFDYNRDCPNDSCSVGGVVRYSTDLLAGNSTEWLREQESSSAELVDSWVASNRSLNGDPTRESMMFLVHFLEDLHQPLHNCLASDYCGVWIPVTFFDIAKFNLPVSWWYQFLCIIPFISDWLGRRCGQRMQLVRSIVDPRFDVCRAYCAKASFRNFSAHPPSSSLQHKVWDRMIIHKMRDEEYGGSRNAMEQDLLRYIVENPEKKQEWLVCPEASNRTCVMKWADEALEVALRYAYKDVDGSFLSNGTYLGNEYLANVLPSFWDQMAAAAVRLAFNLELAL